MVRCMLVARGGCLRAVREVRRHRRTFDFCAARRLLLAGVHGLEMFDGGRLGCAVLAFAGGGGARRGACGMFSGCDRFGVLRIQSVLLGSQPPFRLYAGAVCLVQGIPSFCRRFGFRDGARRAGRRLADFIFWRDDVFCRCRADRLFVCIELSCAAVRYICALEICLLHGGTDRLWSKEFSGGHREPPAAVRGRLHFAFSAFHARLIGTQRVCGARVRGGWMPGATSACNLGRDRQARQKNQTFFVFPPLRGCADGGKFAPKPSPVCK